MVLNMLFPSHNFIQFVSPNKWFFNGNFVESIANLPQRLYSWKPFSGSDNLPVKFLFFYTKKNIEKSIGGNLLTNYQSIFKQITTILKFNKKIGFNAAWHELIPPHILAKFYKTKEKVFRYVLKNYQYPRDYDFCLELYDFLEKIAKQPLKFENVPDVCKDFFVKNKIRYKIFGTKTLRLTTNKNSSFGILTLQKKFRQYIKPQNDLFLELDYNAFELRVLLAILGKQSENVDLHAKHQKLFNNCSRKDAKQKVYSWLFDFNKTNSQLEELYERNKVLELMWDGEKIQTLHGNTIKTDKPNTALNNIIQTSASEIFLRQVLKLDKVLSGMKSFIAFTIHDSVVLDIAEEEKEKIEELIAMFENTPHGTFKSNLGVW